MESLCGKARTTLSRHAVSHILLGYQLREARRIFHQVRVRSRVGDRYIRHLGAIIQRAVAATRHEVGMAELHAVHGEEVVNGVEGDKPRDPRFAGRAEKVIKDRKQARVDEALLTGKVAPVAAAPSGGQAAPQAGSGGGGGGGRGGGKGGGGKHRRGKKPESTSSRGGGGGSGGGGSTITCGFCGAKGHLEKECRKKKNN
jgi:hypothetical protein